MLSLLEKTNVFMHIYMYSDVEIEIPDPQNINVLRFSVLFI